MFNSGAEVNGLSDRVLTQQENDILQEQELTPDGRFHADSPVVQGHLSTMKKQEGVMNFLTTHLKRLTVTPFSKSQNERNVV